MKIEKEFNYNLNAENVSLYVSGDYDGDSLNEVTIELINHNEGETINLTNVLGVFFPDAFDNIVENIKWHELYREKKLEK